MSAPEPDWSAMEYESEEEIEIRGGCVDCGSEKEDPSVCMAGCECAECLDYLAANWEESEE